MNDYIIENNLLGKGTYSVVFLAKHKKTNKKYAIKKILIPQMNKNIKNEIDILKKLNHINIIKLYDFFIDKENYYHFVLEYCEYGNFADFIHGKKLKEKYAKVFMIQIRDAIKYLYENKILHRDLKPQNILISDNNFIKLCDFGFAKIFDDENYLIQTICGTPIYMAPEIIKHNNYSVKSDLWSIGIILYELLFGKYPYKANNHLELIKEIDSKNITIPMSLLITDECKNLITGLLQKNHEKRINWDEFFDHPWFKINELNKSLTDLIVDNDYYGKQKTNNIEIPKNKAVTFNISPPFYEENLENSDQMILIDKFSEDDENDLRSYSKSLIDYMSNAYNYILSFYDDE